MKSDKIYYIIDAGYMELHAKENIERHDGDLASARKKVATEFPTGKYLIVELTSSVTVTEEKSVVRNVEIERTRTRAKKGEVSK